MRIAIERATQMYGERKPPNNSEAVKKLIADAPPRQLRLVNPRKPRGYWLEDGEGGQQVLALVKIHGPIPAVIARKLSQPYGNIYQIGLRLRCWRETDHVKRRSPVTAPNAQNGKEPKEIDWTDAPIFKAYGRADAYASMPPHVWKAHVK